MRCEVGSTVLMGKSPDIIPVVREAETGGTGAQGFLSVVVVTET